MKEKNECIVTYCIEYAKKEDTARCCVVSVDYEYRLGTILDRK